MKTDEASKQQQHEMEKNTHTPNRKYREKHTSIAANMYNNKLLFEGKKRGKK